MTERVFVAVITGMFFFFLVACDYQDSASERDRRAQEQLSNQDAVQVGWPGVTNFTEKRLLKMLYELRDNPKLVTYTYYLDFNGHRHKICPTTSVGYGIPYATQYTAPESMQYGPTGAYHTYYKLPQPEPNGLFMPPQADATWVICLAPDGKNLQPVYVEPRTIVSPFEMKADD